MLDEWHQSSLPSRTGRLSDVILDSSAAFAAQVALFVILEMQSFRSKKNALPKAGAL
jgi:VanZ family protein